MYELFLFFICIDAQFTPQTDNHEFGLTRLLSSAFTLEGGGTVIPPLGQTQLSVLPVNALINS